MRGRFQICQYPNIFNRIVWCVDCGWNMRLTSYSTSKKGKRYYNQRYFQCGANHYYGKTQCTTHNAIYNDVYQLVLEDIRRYAKLAVENPEALIRTLVITEEEKRQTSQSQMQEEYEQGIKRLDDLVILLQKLFEQNISGVLNDSNYASIFSKYQKEQVQLELRVKELDKQLTYLKRNENNSQKWIELIAKYTDLQELDAPIVNELCKKILVHEAKRIDGVRTQKIEIYYRFIGTAPNITT